MHIVESTLLAPHLGPLKLRNCAPRWVSSLELLDLGPSLQEHERRHSSDLEVLRYIWHGVDVDLIPTAASALRSCFRVRRERSGPCRTRRAQRIGLRGERIRGRWPCRVHTKSRAGEERALVSGCLAACEERMTRRAYKVDDGHLRRGGSERVEVRQGVDHGDVGHRAGESSSDSSSKVVVEVKEARRTRTKVGFLPLTRPNFAPSNTTTERPASEQATG